jgi:hypothetical protein
VNSPKVDAVAIVGAMKKDVPAAVDVVLEDFLVWKKNIIKYFQLNISSQL